MSVSDARSGATVGMPSFSYLIILFSFVLWVQPPLPLLFSSFVAEQVSHHPPVSVAVAESQHWNLVQEATAKTAMRPSSLKITPLGFVRLLFPALGERYEWHKVTTQVEDIVSGNKWCDHHGKMVVVNVDTGDVCKVRGKGGWHLLVIHLQSTFFFLAQRALSQTYRRL